MLAVKTYSRAYIDAAEKRFLAVLETLDENTPPPVCNHLAMALDRYFLHRKRSGEGGDGNALNELRMIADGVAECGGVMTRDATIDYRQDESVLGIAIGSELALKPSDLEKLAKPVFAEIRKRFS